ncbi:MAG: multiheme c-type cytochrome [Planctomycetota bacterium]|jgi:hypothetical protein|nr:multiheme c-type cytochrome [Planctomycetota bacterium]MDP6763613.1 multiheme c-type cytochrome [Planctomycetota bacterium]MDP6989720.1 multiheme c-type cytochrome [Planctomycetota bacterium]
MWNRTLPALSASLLVLAVVYRGGIGAGVTASPSSDGEAGTTWSVEAPAPSFFDFARNAFPPTLPGDETHANAWYGDDCLLCHADGDRDTPRVRHSGMTPLLLKVRCRTCHVPEGDGDPPDEECGVPFLRRAFPPQLPEDADHDGAWLRDDCLLCHADGSSGAPRLRHAGMAPLLLQARCRSCHLPITQ